MPATNGAGDAFAAAFLYGRLTGEPPHRTAASPVNPRTGAPGTARSRGRTPARCRPRRRPPSAATNSSPGGPGESACFKETRADTADVEHTVLSRGWADLGTHADPGQGVPLTPGRAYTITLDLVATDHVVPAGHRLALIVAGTDKDLIDPPADTRALTLDLSRTTAHVPFVGGARAFAAATAGAPAAAAHPGPLDGVAVPRHAQRVP